MMSIDAVFAGLLERDAVLYVEDGRLRYAGPKLAADDDLLNGIDTHQAILTELFTYAPGRRCRFTDCYRLRAQGDSTACPDHRAEITARVSEIPR